MANPTPLQAGRVLVGATPSLFFRRALCPTIPRAPLPFPFPLVFFHSPISSRLLLLLEDVVEFLFLSVSSAAFFLHLLFRFFFSP